MKVTGGISWFGGPNDKMNTGTALGLPDTTRGIAVYNQKTLGGYWKVKWPNGKVTVERQVDIGPAPWTNRKIDFTSSAIKAAGYTESNFPTDKQATIEYLGKNNPGPIAPTPTPVSNPLAQLDKILGPNRARGPAPTSFKLPTVAKPASANTSVKGAANFEGTQVAGWIAPVLTYARAHGWKGSLNSGVRSFADQSRIYNSGVRPAARPGTSNHEMTAFPGGAIDVNGAAQLSSILQQSPYKNLLVWAGAKDPVHFSHPHNGSY
ncbi:hypothetical protein UFOVP1346_22 [uncultured Caudovirales phage]|uniref:Uncharacterized protein n=1 Tax=uncultured Caudovirales phage TaxID=2100421 RepID=A0A6J5R762_9CAUD|nr:hypothetical protein UFOVP921_2 [uncultured Caudovirales phage]CAB4187604.1 hypothetical protein UFOVP1156_38 [uncultured Caudovirales phage]CAB4200080.1 hypothetical protein UFOVP1346_22 [uncultured Caudovirales phage]